VLDRHGNPPRRPSTPISGASLLDNTQHSLRRRAPNLDADRSPMWFTIPASHI